MIRAATLSELTQALGDTLRANMALQGVWVTAELSDLRVSGGHCYVELIEKNEAGATVARLRANIWQSIFARLRLKFEKATGRPLAGGLKVLLRGSVTHHNLYGLSLNVIDIDPSYTLGDLERLRREILATLMREGTAGYNKSLPMPEAPQRVAVISAAGAAGYGDFCAQLTQNPQGFAFYPHLFPAVMQGERTSLSVREALERIEMTIDLWDCVVIIRGGGSTSDLNGFDDLELARAVATFPLPVIVGIGHERDRTVLDELAHTRMKTPTAVAAFLIDRVQTAFDTAATLARQAASYATERLAGEQRRLTNASAMLATAARTRIVEAGARLSRLGAAIPAAAASKTERARASLDAAARLLKAACQNRTDQERKRLESLKSLVSALDPQRTLARGYSIVRTEGHAVTDASALKPGATLSITLAKGSAEAEVKKTTNH